MSKLSSRPSGANWSSSFSARARAAIIVIAVVSLIATVVTLLYGQRLQEPGPDGVDSFGRSAIGHRALVDFYEAAGIHTLVDREGLHAHATAPMLFIEPQLGVTVDGRRLRLEQVLIERRKAGLDSIVVLPKWSLGDDDAMVRVSKQQALRVLEAVTFYDGGLELRREDLPIPETAMLREWTVSGSDGPRRVVLQERQALRVTDTITFDTVLGSDNTALIVRERRRIGKGITIIVSDPDLLHNYNLQRGDHGQIALDLLDELHSDAVVIDEVFHGHAYHRTLGAALGRFPAVLLVIQGLIVASLFALAGARSFGRPREPAPDRRSTDALIDLAVRVLLDGRRSLSIMTSYVGRTLAATADRLGIPEAHTLRAQARAIDQVAAQRGLEGGAVELVDGLDAAKPRNHRSHIALARRAHALRQRLTTRSAAQRADNHES
jgi:hypothetical protein